MNVRNQLMPPKRQRTGNDGEQREDPLTHRADGTRFGVCHATDFNNQRHGYSACKL